MVLIDCDQLSCNVKTNLNLVVILGPMTVTTMFVITAVMTKPASTAVTAKLVVTAITTKLVVLVYF